MTITAEFPLSGVPVPCRYRVSEITTVSDGGGASGATSSRALDEVVNAADSKQDDGNNDDTASESRCVKRARLGDDGEDLEDETLPPSPIASPGCDEKGAGSLRAKPFVASDLAAHLHTSIPGSCYKNMVFRALAKLNRRDLADFATLITDNLKRDFISSLPAEIAVKILLKLPYRDITSCLQVSRKWNEVATSSPALWKSLLISENFVSASCFDLYSSKLLKKYPGAMSEEDCYYSDFLKNRNYLNNWYNKHFTPRRYTLDGHATSVVTCLQFEDDYIISGADDKVIRVYSSKDKKLLKSLTGHEGGVWALKYVDDGIIVSGSTDRTVRIWDIELGCCTHVFKGHTSTVRCLEVVEYKGIKYIVTGSRDNTLHVWKLPKVDVHARIRKQENQGALDNEGDLPYLHSSPDENPYFVGVLRGHLASVRTLSGHGNIVISGSYDCSLMVWDIAQMKCLYVLAAHSDRVYSTIYDHKRNRCISASMDATIRVWDLKDIWKNGTCVRVMNAMTPCTNILGSMLILHGHTALVGLLKLSDRFLVSAAADGSLRGWNANSYGRKFIYSHANMSAITTFDLNDNLLVSGSESQFNIYNLRTGGIIHPNLLSDADQIWSVKIKENILVVAVERDNRSFIEIFDFNERYHTNI
ncbi:hypothetical protein TPHA_0P00330 [Tetrapisispora phaffii CBS 4417]|uniref:F-box domain-containing protein n=1 Tax=Tetrapisispora phaffii (strain ATCC 24235 / CBS 4417 / NBRC 1672 / NRRL Y-8282 / UCD 70-5) TaxID=1071381 RepID=G8C213_TETPH|nr:hypothetical protein TPHA_0P00330 [Tetrapisispora phaffii CBS 4417]CCE66191.1 hypothetical protein TPHA_0P00330 [Tetrapisispora phaffii CBS 4417]